ncbi:MAG TPA: hypothetical protein VFZ21_06230 [Gemmatimonadaceae bacterium]|nr:hypothetical protein [Gemmatimonadaceae bacterium]
MTTVARALASALLLGMILLGYGAVVHPVLAGPAEDQLRMIAETTHWRTMHLLMLAGSGLLIAGIWVRLVIDRPADDTPSGTRALNAPLLIALALIALGLAINALNIGYMAGAGTLMAEQFAAGRSELATVFDATHPIGLVAARFGNFLVALGAVVLGWAEWQDPTRPRWLAWLAWAAAAGGFVGVLFFNEASRVALAAVALLSGWELATAVRAFRAPSR